jgi:hypothetical protein
MSAINTNGINTSYPVAGVNNNTQGFRDNFTSIKNNLTTAATELTDLQNKVIVKSALKGSSLNNDMANTMISNVLTKSFRASTYNLGNNISETQLVNVSAGDVQYGTIVGNTSLTFGGWAPDGTQSNVEVIFNIDANAAGSVITLPSTKIGTELQPTEGMTLSVKTLENYDSSNNFVGPPTADATFTNTLTIPYGVNKLHYVFSSTDCGTTIEVTPVDRPRKAASVVTRTPTGIGEVGDTTGSVCMDGSNYYICVADYDGANTIWQALVPSPISVSGGFTIDINGNIGIGNSTPAAALHVYRSANSGAGALIQNGSTGSGAYAYTRVASNNGNLWMIANSTARGGGTLINSDSTTAGLNIQTYSAVPVTISTGATARVTVDGSGNVGFGTLTPTKLIDVATSSNSLQVPAIIRNENTGTGVGAIGFTVASTASSEALSIKGGIGYVRAGANGIGRLTFYNNITATAGSFTTSDERMAIDGAGNVGIGIATATSGYKLDVVNAGNSGIRISSATNANGLLVTDGTVSGAMVPVATGMRLATYGAYSQIISTNGTDKVIIDAGGNVRVTTGTLGYSTGAGGAVTQATSKATPVTINKPTGQITLNNAALAAGASVAFTVNNTLVVATDTIIIHRVSGGTAGAYNIWVDSVSASTFVVYVRNITTGALSEAPVLNFSIIKAVAA